MATTGIYGLIAPNDKMYIGQSRDLIKREKDHRKKSKTRSKPLNESLEKYSYAGHIGIVLHELPPDISQEQLDNYEKLYISQYKECGIELLNIQDGGLKAKHTESSKLKMSQWHTGKKLSDATIQKMIKSRTGSKHSDETRKKLSVGKMGNKNPMYGTHLSSESKMWLSNRFKGRKGVIPNQEIRQKMSDAKVKKVSQYALGGLFIKTWDSVKEAELSLNIHSISWCALGKSRTAGGYLWKYD